MTSFAIQLATALVIMFAFRWMSASFLFGWWGGAVCMGVLRIIDGAMS